MRVAIIKNSTDSSAGLVGQALQEAGASIRAYEVCTDGILPATGDFDGLVVLGGAQNARDDANYPYLPALADLMHRAALSGKAVMGICLGAQLLARGAGSENLIGKATEFGWTEIEQTEAASRDPLLHHLPRRFQSFQWHSDSFTAPSGALHLASSPVAARQAFRIGRAGYGCQFHFEASCEVVARWCRDYPTEVEIMQSGFLAGHAAQSERLGAQADAHGLAIARAWVALI